ncbi:MAG: hypothetical protein INR71_11120, partial [Terriglobus roseus]|nr:hypothetical protein [Terriglobus roseus]
SISDNAKRLNKRRHIITEIVTTEKSHKSDLAVVEELYIGTSKTQVSLADRTTLFGNWAEIAGFTAKFYRALVEAASPVHYKHMDLDGEGWDRSSDLVKEQRDAATFIGATFRQYSKAIGEVYGRYIRSQKRSSELLAQLQQDPKAMVWFELVQAELESLERSAWNLDAFLVKPLQRLTKYPLLLKTLLDSTPTDHSDYEDLKIAYEALDDEIKAINDRKARFEIIQQIKTGNLPKPVVEKRSLFGIPGLKYQPKPPKPKKKTAKELEAELEKLKEIENPKYAELTQRFGTHFLQLQVLISDYTSWCQDSRVFAGQVIAFADALIDLVECDMEGKPPEVVSRWIRYAQVSRGLVQYGLEKNIVKVANEVLLPLQEVWKHHEQPQFLMTERKKLRHEYVAYLAAEDEKKANPKFVISPDLLDVKQRFEVLSLSMMEDLEQLYHHTRVLCRLLNVKYMVCVNEWNQLWASKVTPIVDFGVSRAPHPNTVLRVLSVQDILTAFRNDFGPVAAAAAAELSICNGRLVGLFASDEARPSTQTSRSETAVTTPNASRRHSGNYPTSPGAQASNPMEGHAAAPSTGGRLRGNSRGHATAAAPHATTLSPTHLRPSTAVAGRAESSANLLSPRASNDSGRARPTSDDGAVSSSAAA